MFNPPPNTLQYFSASFRFRTLVSYKHLSSEDSTTVTVSLQDSLKKISIRQLQLIQNAAARVLTRTKKVDVITPVLRSLHWLHVSQRIHCSLFIMHWVVSGQNAFLICCYDYEPSRALMSSGAGLLSAPSVKTKHGGAAFSYYAPHIWNKLSETCGSAPALTSLNQDWRPVCLPQPFTEAVSRLWTALCLLFFGKIFVSWCCPTCF